MTGSRSESRYAAFLREHGLLVGGALLVHRILSRISESCGLYWYRFYRQPLVAIDSPARSSGTLEFVWLDQYHDILGQLPRPEHNIRLRFEQQVKCLLACKQQELVACAWFGFGEFEEDEARCTYLLPSSAVWDFDVFVFPKYRIGRIFLKTWQQANDALGREGYRYTLSRISAYNRRSILSHEKLGAEKVGAALFLKLGSVQLMVANLAPWVSLSWSAASAPRIDFSAVVDDA
ncbi:hypothetical protein [Kineobactrum salinum]|uniref:Uncharacterized protein n=1 Tax=Kineobactrum salinum TaxID=2708301 RepID=A0A6C0U140_9GAMM|nr:hypothetical protein [Kineobactrum salinum]QIB64697.1 hypothetical protein G3T16_04130 [Kineobactrum salinum]